MRKITLVVSGVCPLFLDLANSKAMFGLLDVNTPPHHTKLTINGVDRSQDFLGDAELVIHRPTGPQPITCKIEPTFSLDNPPTTGHFFDFRWVVDINKEFHPSPTINFSKLKAKLRLKEGEFSTYDLFKSNNGRPAILEFIRKVDDSDVIQTRCVADHIAVQITLGAGDTAELIFSNGSTVALNSESEYEIKVDNLCDPTATSLPPEDFSLIYTMISVDSDQQVLPVPAASDGTGHPHLGGICLPLAFTGTNF